MPVIKELKEQPTEVEVSEGNPDGLAAIPTPAQVPSIGRVVIFTSEFDAQLKQAAIITAVHPDADGNKVTITVFPAQRQPFHRTAYQGRQPAHWDWPDRV